MADPTTMAARTDEAINDMLESLTVELPDDHRLD